MNIKNDDGLARLRTFGFTCEEKTPEGFLRYQKRIGDLLVTIANGQFENKIRVSMLQDANGNARTSYKDVLVFAELVKELCDVGLIGESSDDIQLHDVFHHMYRDELDEMDNPLLAGPRKPKGFMAQ